MTTNAIIFARGGSKGLPGKNIKPLAGKPLIQYSIELALTCPLIDQTYVSTEDAEIASIARQAGARIINRPENLAKDTSAEWHAWQHAINHINKTDGPFETFVSLPATSPLRAECDVQNAIAKFSATNADVCISVTPGGRSPYFNMVTLDEEGKTSLFCPPSGLIHRRQDAPMVYDVTTVIYVAKTSFILNNSSLFQGFVTSIEVPKERAIDIDDIYDFKFAEVLLEGQI